tara:strand:+ start:1207 stop:2163 length:957 start_codon:yes stop_codon:yes gene_type:complete
MKILFISTVNPEYQGDYLEITLIHGLRKLLGNDFIEFPKKKIMYHDFSESPKEKLHGKGFTLLKDPIPDVSRDNIFNQKYDAVIYGSGHLVGEEVYVNKFDKLTDGNVWIIDGHDLYGEAKNKRMHKGEYLIANQYEYSFKRELIFQEKNVYPTGYGIPEEVILSIDFSKKNKLIQSTYPKYANFEKPIDLGGSTKHHIFQNENAYFNDLAESWFGLTSIKGGWDTLRHYEIIASGTLLLFRDYESKPEYCSPQNLPCFSYSNKNELSYLLNNLVINNKPTYEYENMLDKQRKWLYENGTTKARASKVIETIRKYPNH